jgi:hypothetical protein
MPRFVILTHDHPFPHFDLMLEACEALRTWRLHQEPAPGRAISAEALGHHRLQYLDYEGPVSGGRGTVSRWDAGEYVAIEDLPERIVLSFEGIHLIGRGELRHETGPTWTFLISQEEA